MASLLPPPSNLRTLSPAIACTQIEPADYLKFNERISVYCELNRMPPWDHHQFEIADIYTGLFTNCLPTHLLLCRLVKNLKRIQILVLVRATYRSHLLIWLSPLEPKGTALRDVPSKCYVSWIWQQVITTTDPGATRSHPSRKKAVQPLSAEPNSGLPGMCFGDLPLSLLACIRCCCLWPPHRCSCSSVIYRFWCPRCVPMNYI
jgi:hypothetical protein